MNSIIKKCIPLAVVLVLFAPKMANAKVLSGNGVNAGGTGNSCSIYGSDSYAWDGSHLAWYKFTYVDGLSDDTIATVNSSTGLGPGNSISIVKDGESCTKYSDTFYLAAYVPYKCGTGVMLGTSSWQNVNTGKTWRYTAGYPIGFPAGGGSFIITDSDSGLPSDGYPAYSGNNVVARGKTVKESDALKAWQDLDPSHASATKVPDSWFCGGEKEDPKQEGYFTGSAKIQIKENNKVVKENSSASSTPTYTIYGTGKKTINFTASGTVSPDTGKNNALASDIIRYTTPPNWILATKGYAENKNSATASKDSYFEMNPGDKKTVCAKNIYHSHYKSESGGWTNEVPSVETCIEIDYVAATYSMGTASQIVVLQNGVRKANAFNIDQNSKDTSTGDRYGNGTSTTGSINNSFGQPSSVTVSSGIKPGNIEVFALNKVTKNSKSPAAAADADIKLTGLTIQNPSNNSNACNDATLGSTSYYKDCYNSGDTNKVIYPEQTVTYTATTSVSSTISASGEASSNRVTTSASVTVTADPLTCKNFNNAKIGQNNPINYGRITFSGNDDISAGNLKDGGWRENSVVYLAPKKIAKQMYYLTYTGCMGHQIPLDINGGDDPALTLYGVSTSGKADDWMRYWYDDLSASNAVSSATGAIAGRNVSAVEVGKNGLARIQNNYEFNASTESVYIENESVGYTTTNHFTWDNGIDSTGTAGNKTVTLEMRVPYNYYIDDNSHLDSSDEGIFVGSKPSFVLNTIIKPRDNKDVGLGSYVTNVYKNTKRTVTSLYINENVSAETIRNNLSKIIIDGEDTTNSVYRVLNERIPGAVTVGKVETETFSNEDERKKLSSEFTFDEVESGQIGQKLCVAVAYYPADSHNNVYLTPTGVSGKVITGLQVTPGEIAKGSDQSMALNGPWYNEGAKTLITMSCATIGKKPTASVEGGSLMTGGQANGYTTTYKGNVFGSWAEYDLLSNTGSNGIGSGASLAYANQSGWINMSRQDDDGLKSDSGGVKMIMNPQSIGNTNNKTDYGSNDEALKVVGRKNQSTSVAWAFAENIYSAIIEPAVSGGAYNTAIANVQKSSVANDGSFGNEKNKLYVIYNDGSIEINDDIVNDTATSVYVIYSRTGINIKPNVKRIDAFLIADNNSFTGSNSGTAYIDTCSGSGEVDGVTYELDRDRMPGNYHLLVNCNETLVVNGAVAANIIELDRAAGGGSDEKLAELSAASLTQRAEIFNYDQRIVFWATNASSSDKTTTANHVKELTPRL